jgi:hypothetical protein
LNDVATLNQPLKGFRDFVRWKARLKVADKFRKTSSARSYGGRESAIEFAMKKELSVLGIETHDVGR